MLAMAACMRKLLCIAYGCWSKGEAFDPTYEKRIKAEKTDRSDACSEEDQKDRPLDLNAPISRTEAQRRRTSRKREATAPQKGASPQAGGHGASRITTHAPDHEKFDFALCICHTEEFLGVHFRRNVLDQTPASYRDQMHEVLDRVLEADSQEKTRAQLDDLRERLEEKAPLSPSGL
jgi:hypothetical protein